jgi:nitronate monooxygenase
MPANHRSWPRSRVTELLGLRYPIIQGPFGGGASSTRLVAAVTEAGGLGSFGANTLEPAEIGAVVAEVRSLTAGPFAVNLWVPQPGEREARPTGAELAAHLERLRPYLDELGLPDPPLDGPFTPDFARQVEALLEARPPVASFVMGVPPAEALAAARRLGIVTIGTASTVPEALALEAAGVDLVVASGSDAGGHRGAFLRPVEESLVGTFSLIPQVADAVSVPVVAAGGVADGRGVAAALTLGADGVQVGTAFLVCEESGASGAHRQALLGPEARTTMLTRAFSGRLGRAIPNRFLRELRPVEAELPAYPVQSHLTQPIRRAAARRGLAEYLNLWAGQAAALARPRTAAECVRDLVEGTERALGLPGGLA